MRIRILRDTGCFLKKKNRYFSMINDNQIINYFLSNIHNCSFVEENQHADICLFSIQWKDMSRLRRNEINILISIESMYYSMYTPHYIKYGDFGNELVDVYIYNHHSEFKKFDNTMLIPTIYMRINYYLKFKNICEIKKPIQFDKRKFLLFAAQSPFHETFYKKVGKNIKKYGSFDKITLYHKQINNCSCYNSKDFLNVLSQYKFVVINENSKIDGYITEKLFNCFMAKCIPIYDGPSNIHDFIRRDSYLTTEDLFENNSGKSKFEQLLSSEEEFEKFINKPKIVENIKEKISNCIDNFNNFLENQP